ncbi:MAG: ferritin [Candidatus Diapherotrites archaeon]|uniref:Ferritin n=1 Tax=Candidatus Iainarchaeum sp. TaxID=3101447 RepID=A0A938YXD7_9ARCH|nr:ferritin [Candidatus Diapherotrites archaeon]
MTGEHEGRENLSSETKDLERARQSLIEELEAINWYQERVEVIKNPELKKVLEHNRDEEKEHAAMLIEIIRKLDKTQDKVFEEHD